MFNFEDELIIEPGVSWLIWIQLLLMVLIFALCCLSFFASDFSKTNGGNKSTPAIASSSNSSRVVSDTAQDITIDNSQSRNAQVDNEQSIEGEIETSTSRRIVLVGEGTVLGREGSQETNLDLHPCSYFRLAKSAFLRCLGLDSSTENSVSERRQRQESRKSK